MTITDLRKNILREIGDIRDEKFLRLVQALLAEYKSVGKKNVIDEWDDEVRADVEEALRQANSGNLISHESAVKMLKKWL